MLMLTFDPLPSDSVQGSYMLGKCAITELYSVLSLTLSLELPSSACQGRKLDSGAVEEQVCTASGGAGVHRQGCASVSCQGHGSSNGLWLSGRSRVPYATAFCVVRHQH